MEIEKFLAFAEDMGTVRLDVGKVTSLTATEAELLTVALQRLRRLKTPMWFNHLDTLEAVLCRDTMIEWASVDGPVVNLAVIDTRGGHYEIAQRHLETGERRTIALSFSHYFDWHDPARVTVRTASTHERIGFGVLRPLPLAP